MKAVPTTLALLMATSAFAAPILRSAPLAASSAAKPLSHSNINVFKSAFSIPAAPIALQAPDTTSHGPEDQAKPKLTPALNKEAMVVKRGCESFDEKDREWIASHPELASVLEQCKTGELYAPPTPQDDHVGACNKWSVGC